MEHVVYHQSVEEKSRKYITEWTIGITVSAMLVGRPQDFRSMKMPATEFPCHLYLVSRRPRMSIHPSSVVITDNEISATLRLQRQGNFDEFSIRASSRLGPGPLSWHSEWPYEEFAIRDSQGRDVSKGVVALLNAWLPDWPAVANEHQVVYIGQAFGQAGERTAWDRLKSHETVQRILAETAPDMQVWLTYAAVTDENLFSEIDPRYPTLMSSAEDDDHTALVFSAVRDGSFREKESVALAEAGLIRFFQPYYNDRMKYAFPARKQVSLESVRGLDFHGLMVEFQSDAIDAKYASEVQDHRWVHFAGYEIHVDKNRAGTITLAATRRPPDSRSQAESGGQA
jgi:hypothetical protein